MLAFCYAKRQKNRQNVRALAVDTGKVAAAFTTPQRYHGDTTRRATRRTRFGWTRKRSFFAKRALAYSSIPASLYTASARQGSGFLAARPVTQVSILSTAKIRQDSDSVIVIPCSHTQKTENELVMHRRDCVPTRVASSHSVRPLARRPVQLRFAQPGMTAVARLRSTTCLQLGFGK